MKPVTAVLAGFLLSICAAAICVLVIGIVWMSANNSEVGLRNAFTAQQKSNESSFDKMWKIIQQQTGVAEHERESFRQTYTEIMTATKGIAGNGQMASFFTQAKIDVPHDLFQQLMSSIESQRESFHRDQQHLLKIKQQHDDVLAKFPSSIFVGGRTPLEAKIVTSSRTTATFESGQDNDTALFQK